MGLGLWGWGWWKSHLCILVSSESIVLMDTRNIRKYISCSMFCSTVVFFFFFLERNMI